MMYSQTCVNSGLTVFLFKCEEENIAINCDMSLGYSNILVLLENEQGFKNS